MRLTEAERKVLAATELKADISMAEVAREMKISERTAQRTFLHLQQRRVILGRAAYIDHRRLGYSEYGVSATLAMSANARKRFLTKLHENIAVTWIAEVGGDRDIAFNITATSTTKVLELLHRLGSTASNRFIVHDTCERIYRWRFNRGHLGFAGRRTPQLSLGLNQTPIKIDELDNKILTKLSDGRIIPYATYARELGLSLQTFCHRVEQLEKSKLLIGFALRLNLPAINISQYRIYVRMCNPSIASIDQMHLFCAQQPAIKMCALCFGAWTYELEIDTHTEREASALMSSLREFFVDTLETARIVPIFEQLKFVSFIGEK